jgi:hypothetical protein
VLQFQSFGGAGAGGFNAAGAFLTQSSNPGRDRTCFGEAAGERRGS